MRRGYYEKEQSVHDIHCEMFEKWAYFSRKILKNGYPFLPKSLLKMGRGFEARAAHLGPVQLKSKYPPRHEAPGYVINTLWMMIICTAASTSSYLIKVDHDVHVLFLGTRYKLVLVLAAVFFFYFVNIYAIKMLIYDINLTSLSDMI